MQGANSGKIFHLKPQGSGGSEHQEDAEDGKSVYEVNAAGAARQEVGAEE